MRGFYDVRPFSILDYSSRFHPFPSLRSLAVMSSLTSLCHARSRFFPLGATQSYTFLGILITAIPGESLIFDGFYNCIVFMLFIS